MKDIGLRRRLLAGAGRVAFPSGVRVFAPTGITGAPILTIVGKAIRFVNFMPIVVPAIARVQALPATLLPETCH